MDQDVVRACELRLKLVWSLSDSIEKHPAFVHAIEGLCADIGVGVLMRVEKNGAPHAVTYWWCSSINGMQMSPEVG